MEQLWLTWKTHRIVDIIDSRETKQVEEWLKIFPNLKVISRAGAHTYASAAHNAHPEAIQVSDRFHLIKNLSDIVQKYLYQLFPSRLSVPVDKVNPQIQALYNTRNRAERIMFAHKKRKEGYTLNDIALLLHAGTATVNKYIKDDCLVINGGYDNRRPGKLASYEQEVIEM